MRYYPATAKEICIHLCYPVSKKIHDLGDLRGKTSPRGERSIFAQTRKLNIQNPYIFVSFPYKNVLFMYFSVIFLRVFTPFFKKLARLCALNRQYQPKNEHSPQKQPKIFPQIPPILKKSAKKSPTKQPLIQFAYA